MSNAEIAKDIIIALIGQNSEKFFAEEDFAKQVAKSYEIIFNKVILRNPLYSQLSGFFIALINCIAFSKYLKSSFLRNSRIFSLINFFVSSSISFPPSLVCCILSLFVIYLIYYINPFG